MSSLQNKITDQEFIRNLIPQKHPFVMVDKLLEYDTQKVVAGLRVTPDNIFVQDNLFTVPGVIEHMAQTVALHTGYQYYLKKEAAPVGYIGSIKKAEIFELPKVDQELVTTVRILHDIMGVTMVEAEVTCGDKTIAKSEMKTVLAQ